MKSNFVKILTVAVTLPSVALMTGCASRIGANNYSAVGVGETMTSYVGTVISKRQVQVNEKKRWGDGGPGAAVGAGAGAVAGLGVGGGRGNIAATLGGAVIGGIAGAFIEDKLGTQAGFEYTVQLDNGTLKTVVQGVDIDIPVGQRVLFHEANKGNRLAGQARSRIVPITG